MPEGDQNKLLNNFCVEKLKQLETLAIAIFQLCDSINTFNRESRRKTKDTRNRSTKMANNVAKEEAE